MLSTGRGIPVSSLGTTPTADVDEKESQLRDAIQREQARTAITPVAASHVHCERRAGKSITSGSRGLMREYNLLAIRKRRFVPQTTNSGHDFEVALNVARRLIDSRRHQPALGNVAAERSNSILAWSSCSRCCRSRSPLANDLARVAETPRKAWIGHSFAPFWRRWQLLPVELPASGPWATCSAPQNRKWAESIMSLGPPSVD